MLRKPSTNHLEEAVALLINNQAAFLSRVSAVDERFSRIETELADIKAILLRHEQMLQTLPDAIRQKIGSNRASGRFSRAAAPRRPQP